MITCKLCSRKVHFGALCTAEEQSKFDLQERLLVFSHVPKPHPAFYHLQYRKAGRAWYLFSREHGIKKIQNNGFLLLGKLNPSPPMFNYYKSLSTLDVMNVRNDTRPSAFFMQPKMVRVWETG